jgi:cyclopropane fatty-acyl-phospholipid synthase-like methyltransferase
LADQVRASSGLANRRFAFNISNDLRARLVKSAFPRSAAYDAEWQFDTTMGPNILWLTEWGTQAVPLRPGMRVLDLGCGKAASSIFLAREFGVMVWAADLWIKPEDNLQRIEAADMAERVLPVQTWGTPVHGGARAQRRTARWAAGGAPALLGMGVL